jgi:[ribosomal protein S18]-alanine N-acetyltransferase
MKADHALSLRPAIPPEAGVLAVLSRDLIEQGLRWRYTPRHMAHLMAQPETACVVACDSSDVQGFAVMHFGDEAAHLILLAVRAERQRAGIGASLMRWLISSAEVAGMASIRLELRDDNAGGLAFYRRLGFEQTLLLPGYYDGSVSARRMLKLLGPMQV